MFSAIISKDVYWILKQISDHLMQMSNSAIVYLFKFIVSDFSAKKKKARLRDSPHAV